MVISLFLICYDAGSSFASGGRATSEKWRRFIVILLYYPSINLSVLNVWPIFREASCFPSSSSHLPPPLSMSNRQRAAVELRVGRFIP